MLAGSVGGCTQPKAELDLSPFIDVWTSPTPPKKGQPVAYYIFQGDFSVCQFTVRGPLDADYSGGEFDIKERTLTITLHRRAGSAETTAYTILASKPGLLELAEAGTSAGKRLSLVHTREYSSCANVQSRFGDQLKVR